MLLQEQHRSGAARPISRQPFHPQQLPAFNSVSRLSLPLVLPSWLFLPWHSVLFLFPPVSPFGNDFVSLTCPEPFHCLEMVPSPKGKGRSKAYSWALLRQRVCFHSPFLALSKYTEHKIWRQQRVELHICSMCFNTTLKIVEMLCYDFHFTCVHNTVFRQKRWKHNLLSL